jgi:Zn-dependent protease with chaperone function
MDFFEAQARAKKRTSRLVVLFTLAVLGTIAAGYFGAVWATAQIPDQSSPTRDRYGRRAQSSPSATSLWQPKLFALVSLGTLTVIGLASLYKWHEFSAGGAAVAESVGGRRVEPHTTDLAERRLLNVVEEMALASGVPMPAVFVLDDEPAINAFAAGLSTADATVAVTRGTLENLTRDELQGVIGHEFSHILNGDMRLNMRLTALVFGILVLGLAGRGVLWSLRGARFRSSGDNKNSGGILVAIGAVGLGLMVIGYVGYFFGRLIQAAVSRQREFLADASAVQFTRNPTGLGGALKKIGGLALGSSLQSSKSAAIGHFFFAQSFRSNFGGLWATHPPLGARIRAIEPTFDGTFIEPAQVVDVATESFVTAGLAPSAPIAPPAPLPFQPSEAIAAAGTLTPALIADAQDLLASLPSRLLTAARTPTEAPILLYGLLLDADDEAVQRRQLSLIASRAGGDVLRVLQDLDTSLREVTPAQKLPLVQLALPALKSLQPTALAPFLETLDALVHADGRVSPFEFALQKILLRNIAASRAPAAPVTQIYSFQTVAEEISVVLSVLAHASAHDSEKAYAAGVAQLKLLEGRLSPPTTRADLAALDAALDKLSTASAPIKHRLLTAAAHVVTSDGQINVEEYELLRAIAAALDVPLPPLAS